MGGLCPLFFDGAVCQFSELPKPDSPQIQQVYKFLQDKKTNKSFFSYGISKIDKELWITKLFSKFAALFK